MPDDYDDDDRERRPRGRECPVCGERVEAQESICDNCGEPLRRRPQRRGPQRRRSREFSGAEKALLPVGRPLSAIAAGYCGLISILPICGLPFQVAGIICGIFALSAIKKNPELIGGGRAWFGIIAGSLGLIASMVGVVVMLVSNR